MHIVIFAPSTHRFHRIYEQVMESIRAVVPGHHLMTPNKRSNLFFKDCESGKEQIQLLFVGTEYIPDNMEEIREHIANQTRIPKEQVMDIYQCDI